MTARAPQLELFRPPPDNPNVEWLVELLLDHAGWLKANSIVAISGNRVTDRDVRAWAEAAAPKIISGQFGYKHTDHATAEEIKAFINTMRSQATRMLKRSNCVRKYAHARIG